MAAIEVHTALAITGVLPSNILTTALIGSEKMYMSMLYIPSKLIVRHDNRAFVVFLSSQLDQCIDINIKQDVPDNAVTILIPSTPDMYSNTLNKIKANIEIANVFTS